MHDHCLPGLWVGLTCTYKNIREIEALVDETASPPFKIGKDAQIR